MKVLIKLSTKPRNPKNKTLGFLKTEDNIQNEGQDNANITLGNSKYLFDPLMIGVSSCFLYFTYGYIGAYLCYGITKRDLMDYTKFT